MLLPDWITSTLAATPALLWVYFGLGVPWALALLPRDDWRDRVSVLTVAFAFGPLLLTAWMFVLGTIGANGGPPLLRIDLILAGTVVMAVIGAALAWRKNAGRSKHPAIDEGGKSPEADYQKPGYDSSPLLGNLQTQVSPRLPAEGDRRALALDEKLLMALIAAALALRWVSIAFWPFTAYDALWVFGYEGRLYTLLGSIPNTIGYYPQFMPLQYAFAQLALGGVSDHAARAVILFTHIGSILAVSTLGRRLFNRRVGLLAAALWALYPHVGEWARFGDLEIPVTCLFTAAAAFFLLAWTRTGHRRRYALIAGLLLGGALWTKPTAGAFIWGVLLLLAVDLIRVRFDWRAWRPRFEVALIAGLASLPLGAVWYVRNTLLGHPVLVFPTNFWLTQAMRSGQEFGWPLLALLVGLVFAYRGPVKVHPPLRDALIGLALVLAGLLPSILMPHRMGLIEWGLLAAGATVLYRTLRPILRRPGEAGIPSELSSMFGKLGWALALALPYFVTWFYSYSYHYRLSFTIVPLLLLPTAALLGFWLTPERIQAWARPARRVYAAALIVIALPGVVSTLYDSSAGWNWLWRGDLTDDFSKYSTGNAALMWVVDGLQKYIDEHPGSPLVVAAPGVVRLPFFFPLADIRVEEAPTRWAQLDGVTYFIDSSPEGRGAYGGIPVQQNQVISGLALATEDPDEFAKGRAIIRRAWWEDDGIFSYTVYELGLARRLEEPHVPVSAPDDVVFGNVVRYLGFDIGGDSFWPGRRLVMRLYWQVIAQPTQDYTIFIHLRDSQGHPWSTWDGPITRTEDGRYYTSLVWDPGEYIIDWRRLRLPEDSAAPVGDDYRIVIGLYDSQSGQRVPVTVNDQPAGDSYTVREHIRVVAKALD